MGTKKLLLHNLCISPQTQKRICHFLKVIRLSNPGPGIHYTTHGINPSIVEPKLLFPRPAISSNAFPALNHRAIKRIIIHPRRDTRIRDNDLRKDFLLFFLFHVDVDQKVTTHVQIIPNDRWFSCNPASFALRNSADNNLIVVSIIFESLGRRASRFNGFISMIWTH